MTQGPLFLDREHAAGLLADELSSLRGRRPLVLGIPRGGVPMARLVADRLGGDLDVILVHKLRAPGYPECAIGAVNEAGEVLPGERSLWAMASEEYLAEEVRSQLSLLRRRRELYTPGRLPLDPAGRVVVVVDDGGATGSTMLAALQVVRPLGPQELIAALPVAAVETAQRLQQEADRVVVLATPRDFRAVGPHYGSFPQVSDEEVVGALQA